MSLAQTVTRITEPLANLVQTGRDPYGLLERLYARHGDMFLLRLAAMPAVHVCADPEGVRTLLTGTYEQFERFAGGVELFVGPRALILQDGEPHRQHRKPMNPGFSAESVRAFGPAMLEITDRVLADLEPGRTLPLLAPMQDITLRVIMRCIFGIADGPRLEELRTLTIDYLRQMFSASRLPLQRIADRLGRIHALLSAEIDRCAAEGPETRSDVLAMLMKIRFEDGAAMDKDELIDQLLLLLLGGYETTSMSLCWAVNCLIENPECLARARASVREVMGDGFDPAKVRDLHYLGAVIQESMRVRPIAVGISRRLRVPMRIAGVDLQPGAIVMACMYLIHRDPALWPEPHRFMPERMLERKPPAVQLFPFGGGMWRCLGAAFAEHEMRIVLARLLARFDVAIAPGVTVRAVQRGITIGPEGGLPVRLTRRADA
jgi:cytochrome P450